MESRAVDSGKLVVRAGADQNVVNPAQQPPPKTLTFRGNGTWADGETNYVFTMAGATPTHLRVDQTYGYSILKRVP